MNLQKMDSEDFDDDVLSQLIELSEAAENGILEGQASSSQKTIPEPGPEHLEVLSKYFGHANFRPMQWEIISAIIRQQRDVCAIMCTGYGKSLCFQYPSTFMGGVTLVVSPLISLMEDQILSLQVSNIPACLLGSAQKSYAKVISEIFDNVYSLVYVTPEFCTGDLGTDLLKRMSKELSVTLIAIDEAHCISSWGHDFRHQYRKLGFFHSVLPDVPIMAVTATATTRVRHDIIKSLSLRNPLVVVSGFNRPNLYFEVNQKSPNGPSYDLNKVMVYENCQWKFSGSTIIYCITRKQTEDIDQVLKMAGIKCRPYHAGLALSVRQETHELFVRDKIDVVVATIAFGMGIDKPDVRNVIHYGSSKSVESYYQEVGRAGRDGLPSRCVTFFSNADFTTLMNLAALSGNTERPQEVSNLKMIENYLTTRQCRRRFILEYFEDQVEQSEEAQKSCCDNCTKKMCDSRSDQEKYEGIDDKGRYDFTKDAQLFLGAVAALGSLFGVSTHILFLRGSNSAKVQRFKTHPLHGSGKHQSEEWWKAIAKLLTEEKYLKESFPKTQRGFSYCAISITDKGNLLRQKIAQNEETLLLQPSSTILKLLKTKPQRESGWLNTTTKINPPTVSTPAEAESEAEVEERMQLYHKLLDVRSELAMSLDCMPYMIASNTALMKMSRFKPASIHELKNLNLDGFTEAKVMKFGDKFLQVINSSDVEKQRQKMSIKKILIRHPLPDRTGFNLAAEVSCTLYKSGLTVGEIAVKRSVTVGTITSHLVSGMKVGHPIKMIELGVTEEHRDTVIKIAQAKFSDFANATKKAIKDECPPEITYDHISVVLAYLQVRQHLETLNMPYEEFEDFTFDEVIGNKRPELDENSKLDALLSFGNQLKDESDDTIILDEPPSKRERTDFDVILGSPPPSVTEVSKPESEVCNEIVASPVKIAEQKNTTPVKKAKKNKVLPPWLVSKRVN